MTVRTSPAITFDPTSDFFRTDRGITWGIKVTDTVDATFVAIFYKTGAADPWQAELLTDGEWVKDMANFSNMREWFTSNVLPKINSWLARMFPAVTAPPPAASTDAERLDLLIRQSLHVIVQEGGTLRATLVL